MPGLGVNIDHVATIRQARRTIEPDPVWAAALAELGGADGITIHLREDRRHIIDRDVRLLKETVQVKLNLEMAAEPEIIGIALETRPDQCTLVPEKREEITTEGGLDVGRELARLREVIEALASRGGEVSLFVDPDQRQLDAAAQADPMDRRDGRNRQRLDIHEDRLPEPDLLLGVRRILELGDLIHVGAGDERAGLAAADHDHLDLTLSTGCTGAV